MSRPTVLAAGGVLWRRDSLNPEVALVLRPRYDDWSLSKDRAPDDVELAMGETHSPTTVSVLPVAGSASRSP